MNRSNYLKDQQVKGFNDWATNIVSGKWALHHSWQGNSTVGTFRCNSLYKAYQGYFWSGESFSDTKYRLDAFRAEFGIAIRKRDTHGFLATAKAVRGWTRIGKLGFPENALVKITENAKLLDPKDANTAALKSFKPMGSVYSKIYSLLVYDLPIYDSRVACALTSLIWLYCKDKEIVGIPGSLKLGIPRSHTNHTRNPCPGPKGFPAVHTGFKYADSNLKAAWILGEWSTKGGDFKRGRCSATTPRAAIGLIHDRLQALG